MGIIDAGRGGFAHSSQTINPARNSARNSTTWTTWMVHIAVMTTGEEAISTKTIDKQKYKIIA